MAFGGRATLGMILVLMLCGCASEVSTTTSPSPSVQILVPAVRPAPSPVVTTRPSPSPTPRLSRSPFLTPDPTVAPTPHPEPVIVRMPDTRYESDRTLKVGDASVDLGYQLLVALGSWQVAGLVPGAALAPGSDPDWEVEAPPSFVMTQSGGSFAGPDVDAVWVAELNGDGGQATRVAVGAYDVRVDPTGQRMLLFGHEDGAHLRVIDRFGVVIGSMTTTAMFPTATFLRDGTVAVVDGDELSVWDPDADQMETKVSIGSLAGNEIEPVGDLVILWSTDKRGSTLLDPRTGTVVASWNGYTAGGPASAVSPNGNRFVVADSVDGSQRDKLQIRDSHDGSVIATCALPVVYWFESAVWLSNELLVVAISPPGTQVDLDYWLVAARSLKDCGPLGGGESGYGKPLFEATDPRLSPRQIDGLVPHQWDLVRTADQVLAWNKDGVVAILAIKPPH